MQARAVVTCLDTRAKPSAPHKGYGGAVIKRRPACILCSAIMPGVLPAAAACRPPPYPLVHSRVKSRDKALDRQYSAGQASRGCGPPTSPAPPYARPQHTEVRGRPHAVTGSPNPPGMAPPQVRPPRVENPRNPATHPSRHLPEPVVWPWRDRPPHVVGPVVASVPGPPVRRAVSVQYGRQYARGAAPRPGAGAAAVSGAGPARPQQLPPPPRPPPPPPAPAAPHNAPPPPLRPARPPALPAPARALLHPHILGEASDPPPPAPHRAALRRVVAGAGRARGRRACVPRPREAAIARRSRRAGAGWGAGAGESRRGATRTAEAGGPGPGPEARGTAAPRQHEAPAARELRGLSALAGRGAGRALSAEPERGTIPAFELATLSQRRAQASGWA